MLMNDILSLTESISEIVKVNQRQHGTEEEHSAWLKLADSDARLGSVVDYRKEGAFQDGNRYFIHFRQHKGWMTQRGKKWANKILTYAKSYFIYKKHRLSHERFLDLVDEIGIENVFVYQVS